MRQCSTYSIALNNLGVSLMQAEKYNESLPILHQALLLAQKTVECSTLSIENASATAMTSMAVKLLRDNQLFLANKTVSNNSNANLDVVFHDMLPHIVPGGISVLGENNNNTSNKLCAVKFSEIVSKDICPSNEAEASLCAAVVLYNFSLACVCIYAQAHAASRTRNTNISPAKLEAYKTRALRTLQMAISVSNTECDTETTDTMVLQSVNLIKLMALKEYQRTLLTGFDEQNNMQAKVQLEALLTQIGVEMIDTVDWLVDLKNQYNHFFKAGHNVAAAA